MSNTELSVEVQRILVMAIEGQTDEAERAALELPEYIQDAIISAIEEAR